jgi:hypothetical protein
MNTLLIHERYGAIQLLSAMDVYATLQAKKLGPHLTTQSSVCVFQNQMSEYNQTGVNLVNYGKG